MATEKRLIEANALIEVLRKSHSYHAKTSREVSLLDRDIRLVKEAPTVDAVELPKGKPGDYLEWEIGTGVTRFFRISAIHIDEKTVRYDIGDGMCPVVNHKNILRFLSEKELKEEISQGKVRVEYKEMRVYGERKTDGE